MFEIDTHNALDYLHRTGRLAAGTAARIHELAWGVSNVVLRVEPEQGDHWVIKQSREKLRTQADWFSRLDRIWREADIMRCLQSRLPEGTVPAVLFEDRDNYLFAMEAVVADHLVWKAELLKGRLHQHVAEEMGDCLAALHRETFADAELKRRFADRQVFVELRVDPFYRRVADVHPQLRDAIDALIDEMFATDVCLVHADFSPKNILIAGGRVVLVDYETGHFGDPAFDLGFFLSHLLLKTVLHAARRSEFHELTRAFWQSYCQGIESCSATAMTPPELQRRTIGHLAGCMLARVDGTSPVDYLDAEGQQLVRAFASGLLQNPPATLEDVFGQLNLELA